MSVYVIISPDRLAYWDDLNMSWSSNPGDAEPFPTSDEANDYGETVLGRGEFLIRCVEEEAEA